MSSRCPGIGFLQKHGKFTKPPFSRHSLVFDNLWCPDLGFSTTTPRIQQLVLFLPTDSPVCHVFGLGFLGGRQTMEDPRFAFRNLGVSCETMSRESFRQKKALLEVRPRSSAFRKRIFSRATFFRESGSCTRNPRIAVRESAIEVSNP